MKLKITLVALFLLVFETSAQIAGTYDGKFVWSKLSNGMRASEDFRVFVNGKEIDVYHAPVPASYASFEMDMSKAEQNIEVVACKDIKWMDVRPLKAAIKPRFGENKASFTIKKAGHYSIEINGSIQRPLFLFANEPSDTKQTDKNRVISFTGNKIHYAGIIELKSNESVYIEEGSVVVGVIHAKNAENIKIYGTGILDGTYNHRLDNQLVKSAPDSAALANMKGKYHRFLFFENCKNVLVEGVTLHNSTSWEVVPFRCENVRINNIKIISDQPSDDGIDICSSRNVMVENCFARCKDDCVAIKSPLFLGEPMNVEHVTVRNCVFWNAQWGNAIEIGFELDSQEVKNILFEDNDVIHVEAGAVFSIHNAGKAHVHDITYRNIRVEDARQKLIDLAVFRSQYSPDKPQDEVTKAFLYKHGAWDGVIHIPENDSIHHAQYRGKISNIKFENIQVSGPHPFSLFDGFDKNRDIENVTIKKLRVNGRRVRTIGDAKIFSRNTKRLSIM